MKTKIIVYLTVCFLSVNNVVPAQEIYTLQQCKELALENSAKVKNSRLDVEIAEQAKKEAFTKYFPSVSAMGMGLVAEKALFTMETDEGEVGMFKNEMIVALSASQPVFAGGQLVNGNKLAQVGVEASKLQQQLSADEVVLQTERYYWQLVSMKEKVKTIECSPKMIVKSAFPHQKQTVEERKTKK
jgi:outer membrane protein TolC